MKLQTLEQLEDFALGLGYKLYTHFPENLSIRIELPQKEYIELQYEIYQKCLINFPLHIPSSGSWFSYQFMGIKFFVHLEKGE